MKNDITFRAVIIGFICIITLSSAHAGFYGHIESMPEGNIGTWVVGGQKVEVTNDTELTRDHGQLNVGACVGVEYEKDFVKKIQSEPQNRCK